jgi:glucose 1-dehydrogenase
MGTSHAEFRGKRALITGGTQGIGKAVARRLGENGALLYLNYARNDEAAKDTLTEFRSHNFPAELCKADLGSPEAVDQMLTEIHRSGPLDLLVCNAAYQEKNKGLFETDLNTMSRTMGINVIANFQLIQAVAREMVAAGRGGSMVISSSAHGSMVFEGTLAYDVSKAALNHLMQCAALELIEHGVRLNAVEIGWTHTPGERRWYSEEEQNNLSRTIPIGRSASADEMAAVFEFLLSDEASYVVGSLYRADGGYLLRPNPST